MRDKADVLQGTLALMVLKTLDVLGPLHGYGIARRIEQISGDALTVNQGTLYPVLLKLEQEGSIASEWGTSENNRKARFYRLTRDGRKQLRAETVGMGTDRGDHRAILRREGGGSAMRPAEALLPAARRLGRRRQDADERLQAEIEDHLAHQTAEYERAGLSPRGGTAAGAPEIRRRSNATRERWREERGLPALDTLVQDTRHALRRLRMAPAFTIATVLVLALGIGATTAIFTLVHAVLLKSLPVRDPGELYRLGREARCCYMGRLHPGAGVLARLLPALRATPRQDAGLCGAGGLLGRPDPARRAARG